MGIHAGDHSIYPDCRQEFRDADFEAFKLGNWGSEKVTISTPFLEVDKFDILKHGLECCNELGLDFDEVYKRTNTSYKPIDIKLTSSDGQFLGYQTYSDYKSAASVERIEAFIKLGRPDPVAYADETGPVSWEVARAHAEQVLANHLENQK
jgi:7-cyano-7-deazaguanine synthase